MAQSLAARIVCAIALITSVLFVLVPWSAYHYFLPTSVKDISSIYSDASADHAFEDGYLLGVGKGDITGPVVEINMMGYADTAQSGTGLRQRLYCRAFIVGHSDKPKDRIVYLVLDTQSGDTAVRYGILERLQALGKEYAVYNEQNVAVTGTHSHSGPGAWLNYLLPQITSKGFDMASYNAIVDGSVLAIQRAHQSLRPGRLSLGIGPAPDVSINRSKHAYLANPAAERARYATETDIDMTVLKFEDSQNGKVMGVLTWLPVHGTSLYQNNTLITGDNKGVAAYLTEQSMRADNPDVVAGYSQANVGDTTPNVLGAYCEDTGLECRFNDSTCGGKTQGCHGRGPFFQYPDQGTRSCFEIGRRQAEAAKSILASDTMKQIDLAPVSSFHTFVDLANYTFSSPFSQARQLKTCSAALGYSFAGGTSDGPGAFDFTQGKNDTDDDPAQKNPLWKAARAFVHQPDEEQKQCQSPKPILLDVGASKKPYPWSPNIVDIQAMRVGPLLIIVAPGEATTMSGRRWCEAVANRATNVLRIDNPIVVLGGPANTYGHYIATEEEYAVQRYEGASTLYGPHTLNAYINLTLTYLPYLDSSYSESPPPGGPQPPININTSYSFITGVVYDSPGFGRSYGQALSSPDPVKNYKPGDMVSATFVGANPRNNFRLEGTFAAIEILKDGRWVEVRTDRDWALVYHWKRINGLTGSSEVRIEWEVESTDSYNASQLYRVKYYGDAKQAFTGRITAFEGLSGTFHVGGSAAPVDKELAR